MPLYEYKCHKCGRTIEVLQKFSDEPLRTHEGCGGEVERLISASAFHLKGSGWYATDYARSNGEAGVEKGDKSEKKADDKKAEAKASESASGSSTDTKTETKSEAKPAAAESKPAADTKP